MSMRELIYQRKPRIVPRCVVGTLLLTLWYCSLVEGRLTLANWLYGGPTYDSRQAKFGYQFEARNDYWAHFVLSPIHDPYLCGNDTWAEANPPLSEEQQEEQKKENKRDNVRPMAILVPAGRCSAQTKALTAMRELNTRGFIHGDGKIYIVVIYNKRSSDPLLRYSALSKRMAKSIWLNVQSVTYETGMDLLWKINDTAERLGGADPRVYWNNDEDTETVSGQQNTRKWSFPVVFQKGRFSKNDNDQSTTSKETDTGESDQTGEEEEEESETSSPNRKEDDSSDTDTTKSSSGTQPKNNVPSFSPRYAPTRSSTTSETDHTVEEEWQLFPWISLLAKICFAALIGMTVAQSVTHWYARGGRIRFVRRPLPTSGNNTDQSPPRTRWALEIIRPIPQPRRRRRRRGEPPEHPASLGIGGGKLTVEQVLLLPEVAFVPGQPFLPTIDHDVFEDEIIDKNQVEDLEDGVLDCFNGNDMDKQGEDEEEITFALSPDLPLFDKATPQPASSPLTVPTNETDEQDNDDNTQNNEITQNNDDNTQNNDDNTQDNVLSGSGENTDYDGDTFANCNDVESNNAGPQSIATIAPENNHDDKSSSDTKPISETNAPKSENITPAPTTTTLLADPNMNEDIPSNIDPLTQWNGSTVLSATCSICIDEFESGELVRVLPRCRHAFHTDCVLPWLVDRQGCCPTCKTPVLNQEELREEQERRRRLRRQRLASVARRSRQSTMPDNSTNARNTTTAPSSSPGI